MAISYEPQQAMDERVYQAYGAAQARAADRDFAIKAGAQAQQAANASSQLAQNDEHFIAQQRQQAALEGNREANQANLAFAQMDHQSAMQQQRQNFEFTQADNLRLQRLNQDAAGWDSLKQTGQIDDREYQAGIQMLNQGRMPLQARRDAAQAQHIAKQNSLLDEQSAREATREAINARHLNGTTPVIHTDDNGNQFLWRPTGWEQLRPATTPAEITPQIIARFTTIARSEQEREIRDAQRAGTPAPAWAANDQLRAVDRQRRINEMRQEHSGTANGATRGSYEQDRAALMTDLGNALNMASPHVAPRPQATPQPIPGAPSAVGFPSAGGMS